MSTITLDTLKFAKTLEKAGLPVAQAEAIAEAFRDATGEELGTKSYLDARIEAILSSGSRVCFWLRRR